MNRSCPLSSRCRPLVLLTVALVVIANLTAPALLGLSDAVANPEPTTWGGLKGTFGGTHSTAAWVLIAGMVAELLW